MEKVLVTNTEFEKGIDVFQKQENFECLPGPDDISDFARVVAAGKIKYTIIGVQPVADILYDIVPSKGVIARFGIGYDNVNTRLASSKGIFCTNTPGVLNDSVAEHTVALLLEICRHAGNLDYSVKNNIWKPVGGFELKGKTICIVGCGNIGGKTALILKYGFGMNIHAIAYDEREKQELMKDSLYMFVTTDFAAGVKDVDFVSLHIPATPKNYHFLNEFRLSKIPVNAWVINTSRGQVVCEDDLYDAINKRMIGGAALDVFEKEPYQPQNAEKDLRTLVNVIMTPHVASNTKEACNRMASSALQNIQRAVEGNYRLMNLINPEFLY